MVCEVNGGDTPLSFAKTAGQIEVVKGYPGFQSTSPNETHLSQQNFALSSPMAHTIVVDNLKETRFHKGFRVRTGKFPNETHLAPNSTHHQPGERTLAPNGTHLAPPMKCTFSPMERTMAPIALTLMLASY